MNDPSDLAARLQSARNLASLLDLMRLSKEAENALNSQAARIEELEVALEEARKE